MNAARQTKISTLIVEDQDESLQHLKNLLAEYDTIEVLAEARDGQTAIEMIEELKPDMVFMDVELPGYNGFEILKRLSCQPLVIFVTAFEKYSVQAFEQNGIDFILKPIEPMKLKWAVARAIEQNRRLDTNMIEVVNYILRQKNQIRYFSIKENDQINIIPREDVFFFHSEDKYVFLHTKDKKDFYNASLKELEKTLDPDYFCRINKSHIVAINKIKKIKKNIRNLREYLAVLDDPPKTSLPIGREYLPILKQKLNVR